MKLRKAVLAVLAAALLLTGCGAGKDPALPLGPEEEDRLTVYVSHKKSVYLPIVREFEDRTGIWVQVVTGGTSELLEKIRQEQEAPEADVMFGGGVESLEAYRDCFSPYVSGEAGAIADAYTDGESLWTPFSALPQVLIYNTKLVDPGLLRGWADLLRPEYRGMIAFADPRVSGSSYTALLTALMALDDTGEDPMGAFARALDGKVLAGSGDVVTAVSEGRASVGITLEETALKAMGSGEQIGIVYPREGTSCLPDGIAIVKNGVHGENARKFLDFAVGKDVQSFLRDREFRRPVRTDIPDSRELPRLSRMNILVYDTRWASDSREEILTAWDQKLEAVQ